MGAKSAVLCSNLRLHAAEGIPPRAEWCVSICVHVLGYSVLICEMLQVVRELDKEDLALLIQFVTGTSKVPLDGFKALQVRSLRPLPHPRCVLMYTAKPCICEGLSACYSVYVTEES